MVMYVMCWAGFNIHCHVINESFYFVALEKEARLVQFQTKSLQMLGKPSLRTIPGKP